MERRVFKRKAIMYGFPANPSAWASVKAHHGHAAATGAFCAEIAERGNHRRAAPGRGHACAGFGHVVQRGSHSLSRSTWPPMISGADLRRMVGAVTQPGATAYLAFLGARYKLPQDRNRPGSHRQTNRKHQAQEADERKREHACSSHSQPVDDPKIAISVLVRTRLRRFDCRSHRAQGARRVFIGG